MNNLCFIDIGANLTDPVFQGIYHGKSYHLPDISDIIERARLNGLKKIMITCGCLQDCIDALELCRIYDPDCKFLYITVGVHPTRAQELTCKNTNNCKGSFCDCANKYLDKLKQIIISNRNRVVALGEFGLDSDRTQFCPIEIQIRYFEFQLSLLENFKLPLFLHIRGNSECVLKAIYILQKYRHLWIEKGAVAHSFTGTKQDLDSLLNIGLDIGINGCSLKTQQNLELLKYIPLDRLHIETDSPWCEIKPTHASFPLVKTHFHQVQKPAKWTKSHLVKGRNEPVKIIQVAEVIFSTIQPSISFDLFVIQIYENTLKRYFS
ncbi:hypothetical protein cand_024700 [Cryptosporidium andersoni]|uniref:Uncharacterized protein n=1 Tax=Cryptosporidium andersoni TaxID=117008 RepID=A0A1J4MRB0_9CRYT|nr:hypothetical protein cand_024700 [Cryptosporidium andersoni]